MTKRKPKRFIRKRVVELDKTMTWSELLTRAGTAHADLVAALWNDFKKAKLAASGTQITHSTGVQENSRDSIIRCTFVVTGEPGERP